MKTILKLFLFTGLYFFTANYAVYGADGERGVDLIEYPDTGDQVRRAARYIGRGIRSFGRRIMGLRKGQEGDEIGDEGEDRRENFSAAPTTIVGNPNTAAFQLFSRYFVPNRSDFFNKLNMGWLEDNWVAICPSSSPIDLAMSMVKTALEGEASEDDKKIPVVTPDRREHLDDGVGESLREELKIRTSRLLDDRIHQAIGFLSTRAGDILPGPLAEPFCEAEVDEEAEEESEEVQEEDPRSSFIKSLVNSCGKFSGLEKKFSNMREGKNVILDHLAHQLLFKKPSPQQMPSEEDPMKGAGSKTGATGEKAEEEVDEEAEETEEERALRAAALGAGAQ